MSKRLIACVEGSEREESESRKVGAGTEERGGNWWALYKNTVT